MKTFDAAVTEIATAHGLTYTRYADDLAFSTDQDYDRNKARGFVKALYAEMLRCGFRPNKSKTVIVPPGARKTVLGLLVDNDKPQLSKEFRANVRQHLYYSVQFGPQRHSLNRKFETVIGFKNHLRGLISFAMSVDPEWASQRLHEFSAIDWPI